MWTFRGLAITTMLEAVPDSGCEVTLLVGGPASMLGMMPAVAAIAFGRRARRSGAGRGATAAIGIGVVVATYWVLTFVAGLVQRAT